METNHHQQQEQVDLGSKINNNSSSSSYLCRQSSSRWAPTNDQIRILKELYDNNGIRSPTADQIQRIAARLRHYGKIEGKNVFYWFQNHKARERQKKRFTPTQPPPPSTTITSISDNHHMQPPFSDNYRQQPQHKLYSTHHFSPPAVGVGSSSSQAVLPVGCGAYGSIAMEKSFRECSISPEDSMVARETIQSIGSWAGVYSYSFDNIKPQNDDDEDDDDGGDGGLSTEIETLQLFPIHGGFTTTTTGGGSSNHDHIYNTGGVGGWFRSDARTSLELSLNSYGFYD